VPIGNWPPSALGGEEAHRTILCTDRDSAMDCAILGDDGKNGCRVVLGIGPMLLVDCGPGRRIGRPILHGFGNDVRGRGLIAWLVVAGQVSVIAEVGISRRPKPS